MVCWIVVYVLGVVVLVELFLEGWVKVLVIGIVMVCMDKGECVRVVRELGDVEFDRERFDYLVDERGVYYREVLALFLAEAGYSSSGIAGVLDVTDSTAGKYLDSLMEEFGSFVVECVPKSDRCDVLWVE